MTRRSPTRILFVCMGNICRSPLAECVFRHKAAERGCGDQFVVDSAGTGDWHVGQDPDRRSIQVGQAHGVTVNGKARQITRADFTRFDLIICMDENNREYVLDIGAPPDRTRLLLERDSSTSLHEVPDPYYGGKGGFETSFGLIDSACDVLLDELLVVKK